MGLWCLLVLLECAPYGGGLVVLQHDLKLSTMCTGSGAFLEVLTKVNHHHALPGATWHGLQSDLQVAAICPGLGAVQARPMTVAASDRPVATYRPERYTAC